MKTKGKDTANKSWHTRYKLWTGVILISVGLLLLSTIFVFKAQHLSRNTATSSANKVYWKDPVTHLMWQKHIQDKTMNWKEAVAYCKKLTTGGYKDWHLPSIDELRSLVRKCPSTETNGPCNIKLTGCLDPLCWDTACNGCPLDKGRNTDGMYLPDEIHAHCCIYWSSTTLINNKYEVWTISFNLARIDNNLKDYNFSVICVR